MLIHYVKTNLYLNYLFLFYLCSVIGTLCQFVLVPGSVVAQLIINNKQTNVNAKLLESLSTSETEWVCKFLVNCFLLDVTYL